jgi:hypothetical protein
MPRAISRSVLISVALHAGLLLTLLLTAKYRAAPSTHDAASIVAVTLVTLPAGFEPVPSREDTPRPDEAAARERVLQAATPTPAPPPPEPDEAPESAAPEPVSSAPPARPPPPAVTANARPAAVRAPLPTPSPLPVDDVVTALSPAAAAPPPMKLRMSDAEHRMLGEKLDRVATRLGDASPAQPSLEWTYEGREYTADVERVPAKDDMDLGQAVVTIRTRDGGNTLSTEVRMNRLAFSSFAQLIDRWDPAVQIHDDEIDGRFHSNSEIYIDQSYGIRPTFHGKVTTARGIDTSHSRGVVRRSKVFLGGLQTRVRRIELPKHFVPFPADDGAGPDRVHRFDRDAAITFYRDHTFGWKVSDAPGPERRQALPDEPFYLLGAEQAELHVKGVVNGKVLVYSPEKIVIDGDLLYAADPTRVAGADDYLGIVSDKTVEIAEPGTTGPGDLTVQAAIYAKREFLVRRYTSGGHTATLSIYGSVAAGSLSATEPRYRTRMHFDPRLEHLRPPSFPLTERYEPAAWDGRWTVAPATTAR